MLSDAGKAATINRAANCAWGVRITKAVSPLAGIARPPPHDFGLFLAERVHWDTKKENLPAHHCKKGAFGCKLCVRMQGVLFGPDIAELCEHES